MSRRILFVSHPVSGDVDNNVQRALRWLSWLTRSFPETTFIAPWIANVMCGDDDDPVQREAGLRDCETVVAALDGIVMVGGRVSAGMRRELDAASTAYNLTGLGDEPPAVSVDLTLRQWWAIDGIEIDHDDCQRGEL